MQSTIVTTANATTPATARSLALNIALWVLQVLLAAVSWRMAG